MSGSRKGIKLHPKVPQYDTYLDRGCELWPTCLGNEEYPQCPFSVCIEDLNDPESEFYDRKTAQALRRWFLNKERRMMNIKVVKDKNQPTHFTGGEYGISTLEVFIDPTLPDKTQRGLVIHCVLENFARSWSHDKVEELCQYIEEALDQLEN